MGSIRNTGKPKVVIVSPHRDDAAFSCGILMSALLGRVEIAIVNAFTLSAYAPFDQHAESAGTKSVSELRRQEDVKMMEVLRAKFFEDVTSSAHLSEVDLGLLDAPLRLEIALNKVQGKNLKQEDFEDEVSSLAYLLAPIVEKASCVMLPLGLGGTGLEGHIDHQIARDAALRCTLEQIAFYEDLPYAARITAAQRSAAVKSFLATIRQRFQPFPATHPDGVSIKRSLARQYPSQIDSETIQEMCDYAEERGGGEIIYAAPDVLLLLERFLRPTPPTIEVA